MTTRLAAFAFHGSALAYMAWGFNALGDMMNPSAAEFFANVPAQRGGSYQYLTVQALMVSEAALVSCLLSDVVPRSVLARKTRRVLVMVATLLSFGVSLVWWPMVLLLPSFIMPTQAVGPTLGEDVPVPEMFFLPLSVDLAMHMTPALALSVHFFLAEKKYGSEWTAWIPRAAAAYATCYALFAEWCALGNGKFAYPFLDVVLPGRLAIYATVTGIAYGSFKLLNWAHGEGPIIPAIYSVGEQSISRGKKAQ